MAPVDAERLVIAWSLNKGPTLSPSQLVFAGTVSLILYGVFIFAQTVRHRDYFLVLEDDNDDAHIPAPWLRSRERLSAHATRWLPRTQPRPSAAAIAS